MPTTDLLSALARRVLVADGAMGRWGDGAKGQAADLSRRTTSRGSRGCNEILNVTRPDVVRGVHEAYLAAGADCVETDTFGANASNLGDYDIQDRIRELAEAGARRGALSAGGVRGSSLMDKLMAANGAAPR